MVSTNKWHKENHLNTGIHNNANTFTVDSIMYVT